MLRQALAAPSRAVRSNLKSIVQRPAYRSQFVTAPLSARPAAQPVLSRRWYSAESDPAAKESADAAKKEGEAKTDEAAPPSAEAELKKKLETKEKEALDWKVSDGSLHSLHAYPAHTYMSTG